MHPQKDSSSISDFLRLFLWALVSLQIGAAKGFLSVLRSYLDSLCYNIRSHTITNVQSNDDKVCISFSAANEVRYLMMICSFCTFRYLCFWRRVSSAHSPIAINLSWRFISLPYIMLYANYVNNFTVLLLCSDY